MASTLDYKVLQYGSGSELQRVGVWTVDSAAKYWVIYIHGGAWRDPRITHECFIPTIDKLIASSSLTETKIAAFASIDYKLSPHPNFPQDPDSTPANELRNAVHPDHIRDIRSGIKFLQGKYGFGSNYVLIGHSAGATMALQLLMGKAVLGASEDDDVELPGVIIGLAGIYDLRGLVDRFGAAYAEFTTAAFGDSSKWDAASPVKFGESFKSRWGAKGKLAILAWSPEDELVDEPEIDGMARMLERDGVKSLVLKDLAGTHNAVWEDGQRLSELILRALRELDA